VLVQLSSSGGRFPAGMDRRYPSHALYPGVLAFYRELDTGATGPDIMPPQQQQQDNDPAQPPPPREGNLVRPGARARVSMS
jgi:hypothetical protein